MCTRMYYYIAVATPSHIPTPLLVAPTNTPVAVAIVCIDESSTDGFSAPSNVELIPVVDVFF